MPTALLSVYYKEGIEQFAQGLLELGWNLLASGGTAKYLAAAGIPVRDVAELVGGGPILGHRVVTLSREVHAGLLARPDNAEDVEEMTRLCLPLIDLVCVDLYPLKSATEDPNATLESVIEMTDIGGPTILRSAAKGKRIVICHPNDRAPIIRWLRDGQPDRDNCINMLARKAELTVSFYCLNSFLFRGNSALGKYKLSVA